MTKSNFKSFWDALTDVESFVLVETLKLVNYDKD